MRQFNDREKNIIQQIQQANTGTSIAVNNFLEKLYFSAQSKRALILQSQAHYAVFFLTPDIFNDQKKNNEEVKLFFELISLLNYLNKNGYITIYREKTEMLYFFQETFSGEKKSADNSIILNAKGDYTFSPDTIHDKNKNIIYKGIIFNTDIFELILNTTTGVMLVSESLSTLLAEESKLHTTAEPPAAIHASKSATPRIYKIGTVASVLSLLVITTLVCLFYSKAISNDRYFKQLAAHDLASQHNMSKGFAALDKTIKSKIVTPHVIDSLTHMYGVDISKWNGNAASQIDSSDNITFIICKATEGLNAIDRDFDKNWQLIIDKKYILGAYHFYHVDDDPIKQAEHFMATLNAKGKTDITPIVDIEQASLTPHKKIDIVSLQKKFFMFLNHLQQKCNRIPMIYTDTEFADTYLANNSFNKYPLWLAQYTNAAKPKLPITWKQKGFKIWQKRDNYFIDTRTYDFDVFYGKRSDLYE